MKRIDMNELAAIANIARKREGDSNASLSI